ncbi:MAG TPA: NB-ARC domain-containing protein, partial [Nitrososphaera sp.]|nr:NB-ARC domain-containing protein [Nitrososphaera sp.]
MTADRHEVKVTGPVQGLVIGDNNTVTLVFQTGERRTVPFLAPPKPSHAFIGRESLFDHLKSRLIDDNGVKLVALQGLPGVGKTALAVALAHAPDLLSRFTDGVLWAGLGREPLVQSELARWGTALGLSQVELADLKKTSDLPRAIHAAIGMSRMLLVVDDAWEAEAALALRLGGPHCAQIFTTRLPQVAVKLANTLTNVPELSAGDSLELFGQFVPSIVHNEPKEACDLVRVVGGLPLALTLMGKYLRSEMQGGQPRRVQVALHKLHAAEQRLRLSEPQSPLEHHPSLAESVPISLYAVISVSEEALKKKQRNALRSLALFPSKPTTFSEEAALATADASTSDLDALADSGLLESGGAGRYAIHQTISDYGKIRNCDSASFERMCEFFVSFVEGHQKDFRALEI